MASEPSPYQPVMGQMGLTEPPFSERVIPPQRAAVGGSEHCCKLSSIALVAAVPTGADTGTESFR